MLLLFLKTYIFYIFSIYLLLDNPIDSIQGSNSSQFYNDFNELW